MYNLTPVNRGRIENFEGYMVELMGPSISSHVSNMVAMYAPEGNVKVSIVYDGNKAIVYRFRTHSELQHYWSRIYSINKILSMDKYSNMVKILIRAYNFYFNH